MDVPAVTRTYTRRKRIEEDNSTHGNLADIFPMVLVHIFSMLPPLELFHLPAVCHAWKQVLRDPASHLLKQVQHTAAHALAISGGCFGKEQKNCWVLNHGMTKWSAVKYDFHNWRSGFGVEESISNVASHGGYVFFYVNTTQFKPFILVWNPVTKNSQILYTFGREHPFVFGVDDVLVDYVVYEETATLSAVVHHDNHGAIQLDYWFKCSIPQHTHDSHEAKVAKLELKYEPVSTSRTDPGQLYPRSSPYSIFHDNVVDKAFWKKLYCTIFCEYSTERRRRCSFHLRWSTHGYIRKAAGRADRRQSRIVVPFGLVLREHDFDTQGSLVVFQDRLFFVVHGCDVHSCNHTGGQCGCEIHVIELFPEAVGVQYVKLARMPLRFYHELFSGNDVNTCRRWPLSRGVWGAIPHGDCILFHAWEGLKLVAYRVSAQGEHIQAGSAQGTMDEAQWTSVPSPPEAVKVAGNMHMLSLDLRLDAMPMGA